MPTNNTTRVVKAEQVKLLVEQNRRLKETADAVAVLHARLVADIQSNEEKLEKLKSKSK